MKAIIYYCETTSNIKVLNRTKKNVQTYKIIGKLPKPNSILTNNLFYFMMLFFCTIYWIWYVKLLIPYLYMHTNKKCPQHHLIMQQSCKSDSENVKPIWYMSLSWTAVKKTTAVGHLHQIKYDQLTKKDKITKGKYCCNKVYMINIYILHYSSYVYCMIHLGKRYNCRGKIQNRNNGRPWFHKRPYVLWLIIKFIMCIN